MRPNIILTKHPRTGVRRMRAGKVKTLAMDYTGDNGSLVLKLDFEDAGIPGIDVNLSPMAAMMLGSKLAIPAESLWREARARDLVAAPDDRQALECGEIETATIVVNTAGRDVTLTLIFHRGGPIPAAEFIFDGPTALALLAGIQHTAEQFDWMGAIARRKGAQATLH